MKTGAQSANGRSLRSWNKKNVIAAGILFLLLVSGLVRFWTTITPRTAGTAKLELKIVGVATNSAEKSVVSFVVSNSSPARIAIDNYFFMCPSDQTWDVAQSRRVELNAGTAATLKLPKLKSKTNCTLLVMYAAYDWKGTVRHWTARAGLWRLFPKSTWGIPQHYETATVEVPDKL